MVAGYHIHRFTPYLMHQLMLGPRERGCGIPIFFFFWQIWKSILIIIILSTSPPGLVQFSSPRQKKAAYIPSSANMSNFPQSLLILFMSIDIPTPWARNCSVQISPLPRPNIDWCINYVESEWFISQGWKLRICGCNWVIEIFVNNQC